MIVSPICVKDINLLIEYPEVGYLDWKYYNNGLKDIELELHTILNIIDIERRVLTRPNYKGLIVDVTSFTYINNLRNYYWYLLHINDPIKYNYYLDKLIKAHTNNLLFVETQRKPKEKVVKQTASKKYKPVNKWFREDKVNMFTNKTIYKYYNPKTKEEFTSDDPNKLEELNSKKTKVKQEKGGNVPIEHMTFSFNK